MIKMARLRGGFGRRVAAAMEPPLSTPAAASTSMEVAGASAYVPRYG